MYFSLSSLTILSFAISALSAPMSSKISVRQAFVPKLTFIGVDYRDYYYIDAPGDGTLVKISMNPSVLSPLHILPVFLALLKYHIGSNPLSVSSISLGGGALCTAFGVDGSTTTLTGTMTVPVGPPQRQVSVRDFEEEVKGLEVDGRVLQYWKKIELQGLLPNETDRRCLHAVMANRLNEQEVLLNDLQTPEILATAVSNLIALDGITTTNSARYLDTLHDFDNEDVPAFVGEDEEEINRWETLAKCQRVDYLLSQPFIATKSDFPDLSSLPLAIMTGAMGVAALNVKALNITASPAEFVELGIIMMAGLLYISSLRLHAS
ncbi:MAG: hypothetical protein LQ346_008717 [Caloplaca aetnensis]|nr:MAG: hypothetical protein LQ346_008717 [Caloplaca aetnensis]